jgi:hypothetical protein
MGFFPLVITTTKNQAFMTPLRAKRIANYTDHFGT